jgi:hypothetical protein
MCELIDALWKQFIFNEKYCHISINNCVISNDIIISYTNPSFLIDYSKNIVIVLSESYREIVDGSYFVDCNSYFVGYHSPLEFLQTIIASKEPKNDSNLYPFPDQYYLIDNNQKYSIYRQKRLSEDGPLDKYNRRVANNKTDNKPILMFDLSDFRELIGTLILTKYYNGEGYNDIFEPIGQLTYEIIDNPIQQ